MQKNKKTPWITIIIFSANRYGKTMFFLYFLALFIIRYIEKRNLMDPGLLYIYKKKDFIWLELWSTFYPLINTKI